MKPCRYKLEGEETLYSLVILNNLLAMKEQMQIVSLTSQSPIGGKKSYNYRTVASSLEVVRPYCIMMTTTPTFAYS